jgi:FkbM family methyltransferase
MTPPGLSRRVPFRVLRYVTRTARTRIGERIIRVPTHSDAAINWLHWRLNWKSETLRVLLAARSGTLNDIGANTGQTLADFLAAGTDHAYVGLEPNPASCAFLAEVATLNRLRCTTVIPIAAAASTALRTLHVLTNDSIDSTASLRAELRPGTERRAVWVNTAALDGILAVTQTSTLAAVKIDVEGVELDVLRGAEHVLRGPRPPILCEVLLADGDADVPAHRERMEQLADFLRQHRYRIFQLVKLSDRLLPRLRPLHVFPTGAWSTERAEECDYLFSPDESVPTGFELLSC